MPISGQVVILPRVQPTVKLRRLTSLRFRLSKSARTPNCASGAMARRCASPRARQMELRSKALLRPGCFRMRCGVQDALRCI